ncbi:MAG TPA: histidine kinase [Ramlibacter sp.]|uniref:sensor histidine kinase n=1 Tax=Ramlibacter sp. TaxID=1917967 RepID=UPI002CC0756E|nr:histidine kinase [Ramlibacter sp.]HVZ46359.1 histidine kinase [Ramlibacter sp.]
MRIDWIAKLRHLLQVLAFCLVIATVQYVFMADRPYASLVAYSIAIGTSIWFLIDMGRHFVPSARETGWPEGASGIALPFVSIVVGFFAGSRIGDVLCRTLGLYAGGPPIDANVDLRNSMLVTLLSGVAASYYFYSLSKSAYLQRKMAEARQHANEARLKLLETQLEPHMLFNTLANLRALIGADPPRAQEMLDHMIAYLRATLNASRSTMHPLEAECERLRDYLELMAIRMGPRLSYRIDVPDDLAHVRVPALLLQPLVENSIRHGLEPKVNGGAVTVSARTEAGELVLEIRDTGVGFADASTLSATPASVYAGASAVTPASSPVIPASSPVIPAPRSVIPAKAGTQGVARDESSGFGLAQVRERLAAVYGPSASLRFHSTPGEGSAAEIHIPLA